jgi:hypothetical protein
MGLPRILRFQQFPILFDVKRESFVAFATGVRSETYFRQRFVATHEPMGGWA